MALGTGLSDDCKGHNVSLPHVANVHKGAQPNAHLAAGMGRKLPLHLAAFRRTDKWSISDAGTRM